VHLDGVPRLVFADLEGEKFMDRGECLTIFSCNHHLAAVPRLFVAILNLVLFFFMTGTPGGV